MPNWCLNRGTISHKNREMIERVYRACVNKSLFSEFIPPPQEIRDPDGKILPLAEYEWRLNNWGTKWEVEFLNFDAEKAEPKIEYCEERNVYTLELDFDSAWCPPVPFYHTLETIGFEMVFAFLEPAECWGGMFYDGGTISGQFDPLQYFNQLPKLVREYWYEHLDELYDDRMRELEEENNLEHVADWQPSL